MNPNPHPLPHNQIFHEPQTEAHIEQLLPSLTTYQRKRKTQTRRKTTKDTKLPQTSVPQDLEANKVVHKEGGGDSMERAITTAASLDAAQDSDNIIRTQTTTMTNVDIRQGMDTGGSSRRQDTMGVLLLRLGGYTPRSDEGRLQLHELMTICTKLSKLVLDLEKKKDAQAVEILRLMKWVKRLSRQMKSSNSQPRKRKYRQFESSDDDLDKEDASNQGRGSDKIKPIL
ncbi:hypothetical protein Tco_0222341, partial [Tanacetum coccineum]